MISLQKLRVIPTYAISKHNAKNVGTYYDGYVKVKRKM